MNKLDHNGSTVELRFKKGDGSSYSDWKISKLKSFAKRRAVKNKGEEISRVLTNSAVGGILDQRDYFEKDIAIKGNLQGYYIVDEGDYVYNPRVSTSAPVGPISKNKIGKGVMSPLYTVFRFDNSCNGFFEQYFKSSKWHAYLKSVSNIGARHDRMSISARDFFNMPIPCPTDGEELHKIEDCLNSIDTLVALQSQKLELLEKYKKGLMQQLFPTKGKDIPELRFPEFRSDEPWKKKAFSQLFEIGGGKDHKHMAEGEIPIYGSGGYMRSGTEYLYDGESACIGRKGTINKPIFLSGKFWTVDTLFYTHTFKGCIPKFVFLLFQNVDWLSLNEAGGVPSLSKVIINKVNVMIPAPDEQQKIVDVISSIDALISEQYKNVEVLKNHKKGLMQQLFLSAEVLE